MRRVTILAILFFLAVTTLPRPFLTFTAESNFSYLNGEVLGSVAASDRFYVVLKDALKVAFKEVKLQDLFTSEEVLSGEMPYAEYKLRVTINKFSVKTFEKTINYIKDNYSGDYIYYGGRYIKVYVGRWYRYDPESGKYIYDKKNGRYVKGYDGNYYSYFGDFYRKIRVNERWVEVTIKANYKLTKDGKLIISGDFNRDVKERVLFYEYDGLNRKLIKHERDVFSHVNEAANQLARSIYENLKKKFKIKAGVVGTKDVRIVIDRGFEEGIKPGMIFKVKNNLYIIRETTKSLSEAEIYKLDESEIKVGDIANEILNPPIPMPLTLEAGYDLNQGIFIGLGVKSLDRKWNSRACVGVQIPLGQFASEESTSLQLKVYGGINVFGPLQVGLVSSTKERMGGYAKLCFSYFCIYGEYFYPSFSVGGEVSW